MTIEKSVHRSLAVEANNSTWDILGKPAAEISMAEAEEMTRRAYAAAYHWERAEGYAPVNGARADWLLSRVWAVRGNGHIALHHAQRCLDACDAHVLNDFDRAYAHEAMARSLACVGNQLEAREHLSKAKSVVIADAEDKALVDSDLAAEPWFGLSAAES